MSTPRPHLQWKTHQPCPGLTHKHTHPGDWGTCRHEDNPETHPRTSFTLFFVLLSKGPSCSSLRSSHDDRHHVAAPLNMAVGTKRARARPHQHLRKSPPATPCTGQPLFTPKGLTAPKLIITRTWGEDCNCSKGEQHQQFQQKHHSRMPAIHIPLTSETQIESPNYLALEKKEKR